MSKGVGAEEGRGGEMSHLTGAANSTEGCN